MLTDVLIIGIIYHTCLAEIQILFQDYIKKYHRYCHKFTVIDLYEKQVFDFFVDKWFTVYLREMAFLTYEVNVTDPSKAQHKNYLTILNSSITLRENHAFSGVVSSHARSNLSRLQRIGVMLFSIFNILTIHLFLIKMIDKKKVDDPRFMALKMRDLYIAIISFFISIVLTFLLCYIFKKATSPPYYPKEYDQKTDTVILVPRACEDLKNYRHSKNIASLLMFQPLRPIILTPNRKYEYETKKVLLIIGWAIVIIVVSVEFIVDSIRSFTYPELKGLKWVTISCLTFFIQFFIFESFFHTLIGIILGYMFKISQKVTTVLIHDPLGVHSYYDSKLTDANWWIRLQNIRCQPCYEPLGFKKEYFIRRLMYSNWAQKWTVIDLLLVTIYLILFSLFLRSFCILECNLAYNHINKLFNFESEEVLHAPQFSRVYTTEELMNFFQHSIISKLYTKYDYRGGLLDPQVNDKTGYLDGSYVYKLLGVPRIRQKRVLRGTCLFPSSVNVSKLLGYVCNDQLENSEDTTNYSAGWKALTPESIAKVKKDKGYENWFYMTAAETNTIGMFGKSGKHYDGGGYIALLSNNEEESALKINKLRSESWLDELTRVVFFELVLYNVNTNTFSAVVFMAENFATGTYITKIEIRSLIFHLYNMSLWGVSACFLIIILLIIFIARTMYLLQLYGLKNFFRRVSNVLSLIACFLGSTAVLLTLIHLKFDIFLNEALSKYLSSPIFLNLYKQMVREYLVTVLIALFTSTVFIRLIFFWFLSPTFDLLSQTVHYIIGVILTILVVFFCFCIILHHYLPNLIQNPVFQSYSSALTNNYSLRQLTKNLMSPENIILQIALCIIAAVSFFLTRLLVMFYYTIARYNRTTNLFHEVNKRSLASVVFDEKCKKAMFDKDNLGDPAALGKRGSSTGHGGQSSRKDDVSSEEQSFRKGVSTVLDEQRIRKMKLITIKALLDAKKNK
ncbi:polycystin family receptor for egg jelly-like isoform X2 [Lycorma delicatula]|uniref:polycystin family receptor for egg jelly-like isoform X2 n=1 Tax=Lycorma delicatula TaxID=130591 RepID=UPI003F513339